MNMGLLLPAIEGLDLVDVRCKNGQILVEARTTCSAAICPSCEQKTERVHSFYGRTIQDLPWSGCPVTINLRVRRFFCDNANCKRLVFCERIGAAYRILWQTHRSPTQVIADAGSRHGRRDDRSTFTKARLEREPGHAAQRHPLHGFAGIAGCHFACDTAHSLERVRN